MTFLLPRGEIAITPGAFKGVQALRRQRSSLDRESLLGLLGALP